MLQPLYKHRLTRYRFKLAVGAATLAIGLSGAHAGSAAPAPANSADLVYLGTQGNQIRALRFDAASGKLTMVGPVAEGLRPTWLIGHPQLPMLYAVDDDGAREGSVSAFAIDRQSGALNKVNQVATGGNGSTNLWLDLASMTMLSASYSSGATSSIAVNRDGSLGPLVSVIKAGGSGPHRRQAGPHAHGVTVDPSGRYALVADLGADRVFVYALDRVTHALSPDDAASPRSFTVPAGSGPRHLAFGLNGQFVYLINELNAEIMTLRWDAQQGRLTLVQSLPTTRPEFAGVQSGAEVVLSPDGRFVYVENRGENTLLVYQVQPDTGALVFVQRASSGGDYPWAMAIHPSGKWMLVANQRSGNVAVFSVDPASGKVTDTGQSVASPTPVSVVFMK